MKSLRRPLIAKAMIVSGTVLLIETRFGRYSIGHDDLLRWVDANTNALNTASWVQRGIYHWREPSRRMRAFLDGYRDDPGLSSR